MDQKIILKKGENKQLNQYFNSSEFDCKCLLSSCHQTIISEKLLNCLLKFRQKVKMPLHINSAFRCEAHNAESGGVSNSQHCFGKSADVSLLNLRKKFDDEVIIEYAKMSGFTFIKHYPDQGFIHCDVRDFNKSILS